jgi:predicted membrane chloride channel (bestrophin family)
MIHLFPLRVALRLHLHLTHMIGIRMSPYQMIESVKLASPLIESGVGLTIVDLVFVIGQVSKIILSFLKKI